MKPTSRAGELVDEQRHRDLGKRFARAGERLGNPQPAHIRFAQERAKTRPGVNVRQAGIVPSGQFPSHIDPHHGPELNAIYEVWLIQELSPGAVEFISTLDSGRNDPASQPRSTRCRFAHSGLPLSVSGKQVAGFRIPFFR
jgi:hypothetical protein